MRAAESRRTPARRSRAAWTRASEGGPADGEWVLASWASNGGRPRVVLFVHGIWCDGNLEQYVEPAYWQALPELPGY